MIGASSLTDEEFGTITVSTQSYSTELYSEVLSILDTREAVSNTRDRLTHYFQARGSEVVAPPAGVTQIYIGSAL